MRFRRLAVAAWSPPSAFTRLGTPRCQSRIRDVGPPAGVTLRRRTARSGEMAISGLRMPRCRPDSAPQLCEERCNAFAFKHMTGGVA